ncbi:BTB/POZ domain protein, partial [Ancylostoma duodenale]
MRSRKSVMQLRKKTKPLKGFHNAKKLRTRSSDSLSYFAINPVNTIPIPSLPSLEGDGDHFCINHEHFIHNEAFSSLDTLRRNGLLCDVELSVVLAAVIPYFKAMFTAEMLELKKRKIVIHNLEYEILDLFVSYAYSGRLHLDAKNVLKVMFAANFFQLDNVTEKCGEYLRQRLDPSNVLDILAYCSALNC